MTKVITTLTVFGLKVWGWLHALVKRKLPSGPVNLQNEPEEYITLSLWTIKCGDAYLSDDGGWTYSKDSAMVFDKRDAASYAAELDTFYNKVEMEEV